LKLNPALAASYCLPPGVILLLYPPVAILKVMASPDSKDEHRFKRDKTVDGNIWQRKNFAPHCTLW